MERRKTQIRATWAAIIIVLALLASAGAGLVISWLVYQCSLYCS